MAPDSKEAIIVPIKILIWVTPDEKILGNNFLKKNFTLLSTLNLKVKAGL